MKFAILSIPHTGTHFVLDLLGGYKEDLTKWMNKVFQAAGNDIYVAHIYRLAIFERCKQKDFNIICPIRHPITTVRSWRNWEVKSGIEHKSELARSANVPQMFKGLIEMSRLYDINFISVDSPKRDKLLQDFDKKFSLDLQTEWRPLNSIGEHTEDIPDDLLRLTKNMMEENKEFFDMFY